MVMKLNSIRQVGVWAAALGLCCAALASATAAHAEDKMTAQSLIDRQLILDQITRYYYNFGKVDRQSEESFYAEDGELILGTRHYKGREGIKQAYNRAPAAPPAGATPTAGAAPAAAAAPPRERTAFNVTIDNPLIIVHGDTATSQVIFTEYRQEKVGDPMKMTTQGKEYATWVKVKDQWLYKTRQIASGSNPPEGWKE
jgi:SnoaL-like domain